MNIRNFNQNPNFNAPGGAGMFNSNRNRPPRRNNFGGQPMLQSQHWGAGQCPPEQFNPGNNQQQLGMGAAPMFFQDRGDFRPGNFYQNSNPGNQPQFRQDQFNRRVMDVPQSGVRQFNCSPDREPEFLRGQFNSSPDRESGFSLGQPPNRSAEREPQFYRRQHNDRSPGFCGPRRSRSPVRNMRHLSPPSANPRRQSSPRRGLGRQSPLYHRRAPSPEVRRSPEPRGNGHPSGTWRPMVHLDRTNRSEAELRQRKKREADIPPLGQPGGKDDPNRRNLCGSRTKWYLRYLRHGFHPDEAIRMAREPVQPAANFNRAPDLPANEQSPSWENPNEFMQNEVPCLSPERGEVDAKDLKVCLLPVGYPKVTLSHQEKLDLEESILQEVVKTGASVSEPLRFSNITFKKGFLKVECANQASADWLLDAVGHLSSYGGRPVVAKLGNVRTQKSKFFYVTVLLPRSADKSDDFLLGLIKSQNQCNTDLWRLLSRREKPDGSLLVLSLDKDSANEIAANDYSIFFRYGKVPVRGLRKKFGDKSPPRPAIPKGPKTKPGKPVKQGKRLFNPVPREEDPDDIPSCIDLASDDEDYT